MPYGGAASEAKPNRSRRRSRGPGCSCFWQRGGRRGRFRFTAEHLARLGVTSAPGRPGKRGFRVYPAWCAGLNQTARKAQLAQAEAWQEF
ncbi:MepB family protein [Leucobacter sp. HY1908]